MAKKENGSTAAPAVKTVDMRKVQVMSVDGKKRDYDISKELASALYNTAADIEIAIAAQELFKTGMLQMSDKVVAAVKASQGGFFYPYRTAIIEAIAE